jgi:hypothetical protein
MTKKVKNAARKGAYTVLLGEARSERIRKYRASKELAGERIDSIEDAVNILVDRGLEQELRPIQPFKTTPEELEKMSLERLQELYARTFGISSASDREMILEILKRNITRIMDSVESNAHSNSKA